MSKILTLHEDGSKTVRTFHTCGDCSDCPYNNGVRVDGCSNVLPCGQYYCWDNWAGYDCSKCPGLCKRN